MFPFVLLPSFLSSSADPSCHFCNRVDGNVLGWDWNELYVKGLNIFQRAKNSYNFSQTVVGDFFFSKLTLILETSQGNSKVPTHSLVFLEED